MRLKPLATLALASLVGMAALPAFADNSTGPTNPAAKGTDPAAVGVPSGTGSSMPNGNVDGSAAPRDGTSSEIKPQNTGNPEGSSMGGDATKPQTGTPDKVDGSGSEGK